MIKLDYSRGYYPALDGLRGIAIILVILFHSAQISLLPFNSFFSIGWIGVDLFFVLSGFLITDGLNATKKKKKYFKSFYAKRALRIFPIYYASLLVVFLGIWIFNQTEYFNYFKIQTYFWTYTQNIYFAFNEFPEKGILNHFWSLAIEEQYYLFSPVLVFFLRKNAFILVSILIILLGIALRLNFTEYPFTYVFTLTRLDSLLLGSIGAMLIKYNKHWLEKYLVYVFIFTLTGLLFVGILSKGFQYNSQLVIQYGYTLFALFFICILLFTFSTNKMFKGLKSLLSLGTLKFFGKYSYGMYIYHYLLLSLVFNKLLRYAENWQIPFYKYLIFGIFLATLIAVSYLSYHFFEKKFLTYKKRFI